MKIVKIGIALLVIVGIAYWAYDSVQSRSYEGSQLEFTVGSGNVISLMHSGEEPVLLEMTASASFAVNSSEQGLSGTATREGSGRSAVYRFQAELPPGSVDFRVTRGSNITFVLDDAGSAEAVVTPMDAESTRNTVLIAIVIALGALYYISKTLEHTWLKAITQRVSPRAQASSQQASASEAGN